ncbi:hypothetical protein B0P06_000246 [Clostridium saccharoperbutylacetonicum]|uniref:hypothetical protein n=1 Tax=Clostridium saccharoperbutylacetonicum TaxID=36745 RepID=UPI00034D717F|nr:hypothetical protein [Clostridium saccharoperbutylacetonicum]NRT63628.1 hypothetical protein [Clostridium saccharoperbutylacetonicum]NSB26991.1 hypothetical protein [Clostridium saccharoperbutylacetonicum]NSB40475.1 hypothetical protein [Clostridium saccharoperbutylacetonicum]
MYLINNKYILKKLEFDKTIISEEVQNISNKEGRFLVNEIANEVLNLKERF